MPSRGYRASVPADPTSITVDCDAGLRNLDALHSGVEAVILTSAEYEALLKASPGPQEQRKVGTGVSTLPTPALAAPPAKPPSTDRFFLIELE